MDLSFDQWCADLNSLAKAEGCDTPYTEQTGRECWWNDYQDGVTPAEAWAEEKSCAADCHDASAA